MKKLFFLAVACCLMACQQNGPEQQSSNSTQEQTKQTKSITFNIAAFSVSTQAMAPSGLRKAPILDDQDGQALTDLYIFEGSTQLAHQTSDAADFGTLTLTLDYGSHNLAFIATRSTGVTISNGILHATSVRPTFGTRQTITVGDSSDEFDITISRITGQLIITMQDAIPADADHLIVQVAQKYDDLTIATFAGANPYAFSQSVNITSKVGMSNQTWTLNIFAAVYGEQYTTDVTLSVYKSDDSLIAQHVIHNVPLVTNTKTILSGEMFGGQNFTITADHTWEDSLNPAW